MSDLIFPAQRTAAVIVTFRTDIARLEKILRQLVTQCGVVICDNTDDEQQSRSIEAAAHRHGATYIGLGGNAGIAKAQNVGIQASWERGAEHVLLLDDDSVPPDGLVKALHLSMEKSKDRLAVVGARTFSSGRDISNAGYAGDLTPCRELMSSGTLISKRVFDTVGPFDEGLFIDGVDFDWGWRAQSLGIPLYLSADAVIEHRLGIGDVGVGGLRMRLPSPIRHYYQYRNMLRLMTRPYTPWKWRASQALRLPTKLVLLGLFAPRRIERLRLAFMGIRDAVTGRQGSVKTDATGKAS